MLRREWKRGKRGLTRGWGRGRAKRKRSRSEAALLRHEMFFGLKACKEELNKVEKIFKKHGHVCIFLPKYHPELNAIERYWGYIKHLLRLHCEYSLPHMLKILPGSLRGVPLRFIRAWCRISWLYLEAYDKGLVDYLEIRDLNGWHTHRLSTDRGDAVFLARGKGKTEEEKRVAEAKALAAVQRLRTLSIRSALHFFVAWKRKVTAMKIRRLIRRERANTAWANLYNSTL